jgi:hypothetical protein
MREFNLEDTFALSEILDKTGMEIDLNAFMDAATKKNGNAAYLGGQMVMTLVKKIYKAKKEVISFIAGITEDDIENVKKYNIAQIKAVFTELFSSPDFKDFFSNAGA